MNDARLIGALRSSAVAFAIAMLMAAPPAEAASVSADQLTDAHVQAGINAIKAELMRRCDEHQFWEPVKYDDRFESRQKGGWTALAVLALLTAGESYQQPKLRDAIEYLETTPM